MCYRGAWSRFVDSHFRRQLDGDRVQNKNSLTVLHLPTLTERETSTLMGGPNCPYDGATGAVRIMGFAGSLFAAIMVHAGCVRTFRVVVDDEGLLDSQFR